MSETPHVALREASIALRRLADEAYDRATMATYGRERNRLMEKQARLTRLARELELEAQR